MGFDLSCLDPISWVASATCGLLNDLGVPKSVTDGIEAGAAIVFCDPILGVQAAKDIIADNQTPPAAQTHYEACDNGYNTVHGGMGSPGEWRIDEFDCGDGLEDILNDPTLSTEAKMTAVLGRCMDATDGEINQTLKDLDLASNSNDGKTSNADVQKLQVKLQQLMQQRQEMFTLMTDTSKTFHDMSMAAINNMRG